MASNFTRPTLEELRQRIHDDLNATLPGADSRVRKTTLRALTFVMAGTAHTLYGFVDAAVQELFPDTAGPAGVRRWRKLYGLAEVEPAKATGSVTFTGTNGTTLSGGEVLTRTDGRSYTTDAGGTVAGGTLTLNVTAEETGTEGNADTGVLLTLSTPVSGLDSTATVDSPGLTGGTSEESVEAERTRVQERMATPPTGGNPADWIAAVKATGGVRDVWISPNTPDTGEVQVRFTVEGASPLPSTAKVDAVQDYLAGTAGASPFPYADAWAPVPLLSDDRIDVRELTGQVVDFTITTLSPDTTAIRAAVQDALEALLLRVGQPGGTIYLSQITGAIDAVAGEDYHVMTVPAADVAIGADSFPTMGTITWPS